MSYPTKAQTKLNFSEVETAIKMKLHKLLEQLNQRNNRAETMMDFVDDCIVESEEQDLSTQFQHMQKNQLIDLQEHFERYCIVLPVFGFNSAKINDNYFKPFLLPTLVENETLNRQLERRLINLFPSNSMILGYLTWWISSVVSQVSIIFSKPLRVTREKFFALWMVRLYREIEQQRTLFGPEDLSSKFCATVTPLGKITMTLKTLFKVVYLETRRHPNCSWTPYLRLEEKITLICKISGTTNICNLSQVLWQQSCCPNAWSDAENDWILRQQRYWYIKPLMRTTKFGQ